VALGACVLVGSACTVRVGDGPEARTGELKRETRSVSRATAAKAERVAAEIHMGAGELTIGGGAKELLDAEFEYNVPEWKPEVRYEGEGGFRGKLVVRQGSATVTLGDITNRWRLHFADNVPLDLSVRCGAGENQLDLSTLDLRSAEVHMGAGRVDLDLRGRPGHDREVSINGGVGEARIRVSKDANVIATAKGGIGEIHVEGMQKRDGEYLLENKSEKSTLRLSVKGGIGRIEIRAE
jgi:hypothetical protein